MKIKVVELSSGFANVQNRIILASDYRRPLNERPGSANDEYYTIELPDDYEIDEYTGIWRGREHIELVSVNHTKKHVTASGDPLSGSAWHYFPIVDGE